MARTIASIIKAVNKAAEQGRQSKRSAMAEVSDRLQLTEHEHTAVWDKLALPAERERRCGWDD